jgi:hypothetical protein
MLLFQMLVWKNQDHVTCMVDESAIFQFLLEKTVTFLLPRHKNLFLKDFCCKDAVSFITIQKRRLQYEELYCVLLGALGKHKGRT